MHSLIWSGALNIGLLCTLIHRVTTTPEAKQEMVFEAISLSQTNAQVLKGYFNHSFRELVAKLSDSTLLEDGYTARDLALSCLVEYHDFYLDRALSGFDYQTRHMTFIHNDGGEKVQLPVYPGLRDEHFERICEFALKEQWPLTAEGLFFEMKRRRGTLEESLKSAFYLTPHFEALYSILSRENTVTKEEVLALAIEGDFDILKQLVKEQRIKPDLSADRRQLLLRSYLSAHSQIAPYLLVRLEPEYTLKRLNDDEILRIIEGLKVATNSGERFLQRLIGSLRSDIVQQTAGERLFAHTGIRPETKIKVAPQKPTVQQTRTHTVKEGDSLWKIARQYGVSIDRLAKLNNLNKDRYIRPGQKLEIP